MSRTSINELAGKTLDKIVYDDSKKGYVFYFGNKKLTIRAGIEGETEKKAVIYSKIESCASIRILNEDKRLNKLIDLAEDLYDPYPYNTPDLVIKIKEILQR